MRSDEDLALSLLSQRNVYVHPGHFYDFPSDGHLVLSLISPETDLREAVSRILVFFN
jgi:aspartate/methionine/tyrosine aminotransferase